MATFRDAAGDSTGHVRLKPDAPPAAQSAPGKPAKPVKYESPKGGGSHPYFPAAARAAVADPAAPLIVTEGVKKAVAASQHGFPAISLVGVERWSEPRPKASPRAGGTSPIEIPGWADELYPNRDANALPPVPDTSVGFGANVEWPPATRPSGSGPCRRSTPGPTPCPTAATPPAAAAGGGSWRATSGATGSWPGRPRA